MDVRNIAPTAKMQDRLNHLRREADSGQLTVTSFIRRACKVFFSNEEVSRGGIGLLDEKKLDIILTESRRYYPDKATESLVMGLAFFVYFIYMCKDFFLQLRLDCNLDL